MFEPNEILSFDCPVSVRPFLEAAQKRADIGIAGCQLAKIRRESKNRPPRVFTGRVGRKRGWRGMSVILPNGKLGNLIMALGGIAVVRWHDSFILQPNRIGYFRVRDLQRFKIPAAALLGALKKGVKEKHSIRKKKSSRINGCTPPRPGSRPRGRPRSIKVSEPAFSTLASRPARLNS
jgi:hypothetical protein